MAKTLILKTDAEPSFFNRDMAVGAALGLLVPGGLVIAAVGAVIGAAIGGAVGKNRMEHEKQDGKVVSEGSFWNKDTLIGGVIGNKVGMAVGLVAAAAIALAGFVAVGGSADILSSATTPQMFMDAVEKVGQTLLEKALPYLAGAGAAFLGSWAGGTAIGAYIGGKSGQRRLDKEYEEAKHQTIVEHLSKTVSPEVGKAVEYSMEHNKEWGKQVSEDRMLALADKGHSHP